MGKKFSSLMMEGKFSGEVLQSLHADEDLMSAIARELVEKAGVGDTADAIWKELGDERGKTQAHPVTVIDDIEADPVLVAPDVGFPEPQPSSAAWSAIHLVEPPPRAGKNKSTLWPTAVNDDAQLKLFG